jgi:DNA-binding transcriptional ArsR family regulator
MAELIAGSSPPEVIFHNSLPLNLLLTLALVPAAEQFEGLDEWLRGARSALPAGLRQEIALLTGFPGGHLRFVEAVAVHTLSTDEQMRYSFAAWAASLAALSPADFQAMALWALRRGSPEEPAAAQDLLDRQSLQTFLASRDPQRDHSEAVALVLDPQGLRDRFLEAVTQFWGQVYQAVYEEELPLLERSVTYHRGQSYPAQFDELFLAVTGRVLPAGIQHYLPEVRRVRFVPSCHLGPYVAFFRAGEVLTVFYNCRGTLLAERQASEQVRHLYPLLKALADETRLQILALLREREMYAQEIVERLGLSQPAVSRHLRLMAAAGLLKVRPEGGAKHYLPDREVLARMVAELEGLSR